MSRIIIFFCLIVMIGFSLCVNAAQAQSIECGQQKPPRVLVSSTRTPVEYDFTKSTSDLDAVEKTTENPYGDYSKTHTGGLMRGGIELAMEIETSHATFHGRPDLACVWISTITLNLKQTSTIYVANDYKRGSCQHREIKQHEKKHVGVDSTVMKNYERKFKRLLNNIAYRAGVIGPGPTRQVEDIKAEIFKHITGEIDILSQEMYDERANRQQMVDNIDEYERVAAACGN